MTNFTDVKELANHQFEVVKQEGKYKKMTAGRFSKVIGVNHWGTPFQAWCEIVKTRIPPFEDNKYTVAGKVIEPKLIEFSREAVSPYIRDPEQYYECEDAKREMWYEFFDDELFGGMWDALAFDRPNVTGKDPVAPIAVIECKTSSRPQDWENGVPDNYKAQGLLYAQLLDVDDVYFPVAFLEPDDYDDPENFECTDENTRIYHITRDEPIGDLTDIGEAMDYAWDWYQYHVVGNISPEFDPKKDAEYLSLIRSIGVEDLGVDNEGEETLESLVDALDAIDTEIEAIESANQIDVLKKQRKEVNAKIQAMVKPILSAIEGKDALDLGAYKFTVSPSRRVDYARLEEDGVSEKYIIMDNTIRTKRVK